MSDEYNSNQTLDSDFLEILYKTAESSELLPGLISETNDILEETINHPNTLECDNSESACNNKSSGDALSTVRNANNFKFINYPEHQSVEVINTALASLKPLANHFQKAKELYDKFNAINDQFLFNKQLANYLPAGIFFVNKQLKVLFLNDTAKRYCEENALLQIQFNILTATDNENQQRLIQYISRQSQTTDSSITNYLSLRSHSHQLRLLADHNKAFLFSPEFSGDIIALFVIPPDRELRNFGPQLSSIFKLSPAEYKLSVSLLEANSLDEAANINGISAQAASAHLNSIYIKTNTNSPAGLITKILSTPLIHRNNAGDKAIALTSKHEITHTANAPHCRSIRLNDNRIMTYAEFGDPSGQPVFLLHRNYGCRLQRHPDDSIAKRFGVRLIVPDRPGVGQSDVNPRHNFLTWTNDFIQLCDHLAIKTFSIIGNSTGSCYALACVYKYPLRTNCVLLLNAPAPFKSFPELRGMAATELLLVALARYSPWLLNSVFKSKFGEIAHNPQIYLDKIINTLGEDDRSIFNNPAFKENFLQSAKESVSKSTFGLTRDFILMSRNWGFDLSRISNPIHCWYGTQGNIIPNKMAIRLIKTLPYSIPRFDSRAGHHMLYSNWETILNKILNR